MTKEEAAEAEETPVVVEDDIADDLAELGKEYKPKEEPKEEVKEEEAGAEAVEGEAKAGEEKEEAKEEESDPTIAELKEQAVEAQATIAELQAKVDEGGKLTPTEEVNLTEAQKALQHIEGALAAGSLDMVQDDTGKAVATVVVDLQKQVAELRASRAEMAEQLASVSKSAAESREATIWAAEEAKYPGVQAKGIWEKVLVEKAEELGVDMAKPLSAEARNMLNRAATHEYEKRCKAAASSVAGKRAMAEDDKPTKVSPTAITKGGGRATLPTGSTRVVAVPIDEEEEFIRSSAPLMR